MNMNQVGEGTSKKVEKSKEIWNNMEMLEGIISSIDRTIAILKDDLNPILKPIQEKTPSINKEAALDECQTQLGSQLRSHYSCLDTLELSLEDLINRLEI